MTSNSIQKQLKKLLSDPKKVRQLKFENGETVEQMLESEAQKLIDILEEEIDRLYLRREGWYKRSGDLKDALDKKIVINPRTNTITIGFLDDKAWHDSWITKQYDLGYSLEAYVPQGVREGYEVFNTGHYVSGVDYLQRAVDRFDQVKRPGITVRIDDSVYDNWWR